MKKLIIWDSTESITGATKVSLSIYELLKNDYHCSFFIPGEGEVSSELRKRKIDYKVIRLGNYSSSKKTVKDVLLFICYVPRVFFNVLNYVKRNKIDLIYSNAIRYAIFSSLIGKLFSIPIIWHIHHFIEDNKARFIINKFGNLNSIKTIVFVSKFVKTQYPLLAHKSIVVYNGVNIDELKKKSAISSLDIRKIIAVSKDVKIVSVINHITPTKKQEVFIKSIPFVIKQYQKVHFVIAGQILDESYSLFLKALVSRLGVGEYVSFLGYCRDIPGLLNNIYLNTITSLEGFSLILQESHALGTPSLIPDVGGPLEVIKNDEFELIYEFDDEQDLARKTLKLLKDEKLYCLIRDNCKNRSNSFDIRIFNQKIDRIVGEVFRGGN